MYKFISLFTHSIPFFHLVERKDNTSSSSSSSSEEEKEEIGYLTPSEEEYVADIDEGFEGDWYVPRNRKNGAFSHIDLLGVVFVAKDLIRSALPDQQGIKKDDFMDSITRINNTPNRLLKDLTDRIDWQKIRFVLRNMVRRYVKEDKL